MTCGCVSVYYISVKAQCMVRHVLSLLTSHLYICLTVAMGQWHIDGFPLRVLNIYMVAGMHCHPDTVWTCHIKI